MAASLARRETIELRGALAAPVLRVAGWRLGDWAAHHAAGMPGRWSLTLLPLGMCLPTDWATFASERDALGALRAIVRLRNDWHCIAQGDLTRALKARLQYVCRRWRALERAPVGLAVPADQDIFGLPCERLNGYAA